jgi:uncharacterized protein DUF6940
MIFRVTKSAGLASQYSAEISQLDEGCVLRFRLLHDGGPLSWSDVVDRWQNDQLFRCFFISILGEAPFPAYFWETPPVTRETINRDFEFVLVESPQLAGVHTDQQAFANHFTATQPGTSVIEFSNLGGDAILVVPCPLGPLSAYSHIRAFAHEAPDEQQHQLWQRVGMAIERRLGTQPVWVSTSGLGIYWLHIRLDSLPKYYTYKPYRIR